MFGKRQTFGGNTPGAGAAPAPQLSGVPAAITPARTEAVPKPVVDASINRLRNDEIVDVRSSEAIQRDKEYFQTKSAIFNALIDSIDLSQLATIDLSARKSATSSPKSSRSSRS